MSHEPMLPPLVDVNIATENLFIPLAPNSFHIVPGDGGLEVRDVGLGVVSNGEVVAQVFRSTGDKPTEIGVWHMHNRLSLQIGYIIKGWLLYEFEGLGEMKVEAGTVIYHQPRTRLRVLGRSPDFEGIWIKGPSEDHVTFFEFDHDSEAYKESEAIHTSA